MIKRAAQLSRLFSPVQLLQMKVAGHVQSWADKSFIRHGVALRELRWHVPEGSIRREDGVLRFARVIDGFNREFALRPETHDIEVFLQVIRDEEYREAVTLMGNLVRPRIIDAGANIGLTTLFFKSVFPDAQIIALEPEPSNFQMLERTLELNNLADVTPVRNALWTHDASLSPDWSFRGGRSWSFAVKEGGSGADIVGVRLDSILDDHGWPRADLLKIDIEGAEAHLIRHRETLATMAERATFVCIEVHGEMIGREEARAALASVGLRSATSGDTLFAWRESVSRAPDLALANAPPR